MDSDKRFQNLGANLALFAIAVIWGMNFVSMKHLIGEVGALKVVLLRVFFAALLFAVILVVRGA